MGIYRKPGKQEAYMDALESAELLCDDELNYPGQLAYNIVMDKTLELHIAILKHNDIRDVVAKAIHIERGRRIGKTTMTKKSFDLNAIDCGMLSELQTELGHSTEVATLRAAIQALYAHTFG